MESSIHSESHIQLEEELEMQCKICYLKTTPLLRLCNCKGSIGFVHEECILKWVTRKLEKQTVLEMPSCELCKTPYSAQLKCKQDRLSLTLVGKRVKELDWVSMAVLIITILGLLALPYIELIGAQSLWEGHVDNYVIWLFSFIIFPYCFGRASVEHLKQLGSKWKDCLVRQVEIYLLPKQIYR